MSLALFAVCKGAWWGPSLWRTHGEIPYHWFANDDDDDDDDHDDWWWWSLCSRWLLTTFFFHRKTASWPPSPGGFWPTMFFSLVIFAQPSLFVSFFPVDVKVGWFFFHIALKMISSQCISLFAPHRNWGYQKSFHTGTIWSSPGLLSLPELTKSWGADYTEIANDDQDDQSGCNDAVTIANDDQDVDDNADNNIEILLSGWRR